MEGPASCHDAKETGAFDSSWRPEPPLPACGEEKIPPPIPFFLLRPDLSLHSSFEIIKCLTRAHFWRKYVRNSFEYGHI